MQEMTYARKRRWPVTVALLAVVSSVLALGTVAAQEEEPAFFAGVVLAVDPDEKLLTVEEANLEAQEMTFVIRGDTKVEKDQKSIDLTQIEVGDPVSIEYETNAAGEHVAGSVEIITKPSTT